MGINKAVGHIKKAREVVFIKTCIRGSGVKNWVLYLTASCWKSMACQQKCVCDNVSQFQFQLLICTFLCLVR